MTYFPKSDYIEYPKTLPRDDLWGQVRRTRNGKPVSEREVEAIVSTVRRELDIGESDVILDLACGNGALSARAFIGCRGVTGVDRSSYLIEIARENFQKEPFWKFTESDINDYLHDEPDPGQFTKAMMYASIQYLSPEVVTELLSSLFHRFGGVTVCLIGNVPDRDQASLYYEERGVPLPNLDDPVSQIGVWWAQEDLARVAENAGWHVTFSRMPGWVFNAAYRYDTILRRPASGSDCRG